VPKILRSKNPLRTYVADADALGTWLRSERLAPSHLEAENWIHPFEVILDDFGGLKQTVLLFSAGNPGWFARPERPQLHDPKRNVLRELVAGQLLIADRPIDSDRLREIVVIGQYHIYEGRGP
jgi:hypothetical protein